MSISKKENSFVINNMFSLLFIFSYFWTNLFNHTLLLQELFFVCGHFSLPSDIHRSIMYAYRRKYLDILNVRKPVKLRQKGFFLKFINIKFFRNVIVLYTFIMYICWYIKCLLYVYSFSLIWNMSIVFLLTIIIGNICIYLIWKQTYTIYCYTLV